MSVQVENLEKSMAKLTIEVSAEQFEAAMQKAYIKNKGRIQLPGFRKGKAFVKGHDGRMRETLIENL